ncbi:M66 family metalloprotease [Sodalis sp. C49]|uniref:M66 family metalloprotease n=1 Tax=Sodalis sp. C49 TaxID=3228929 RepID=UPI00396599A5
MEILNNFAFDELPATSDLTGNFEARICYAQNITLYQRATPHDIRPRLVAQRDTLLLVQPRVTLPPSISVTGTRADGVRLGVLDLVPPAQLPTVDSPAITNIIYARNMWSVILPATWINPGLRLLFEAGNQSGSLHNIVIGAPNEVIIQTIDIGMLVTPRDRFDFANQPSLHRDYYQKIPVSRLIVGEYEPIHLTRVVMPNGVIYTSQSADNGSWHTGDMREYIGKFLISQGINCANYGINSSDGSIEIPDNYVAFQITAHNSRGRYQNGIIVHGGSGGNGMLTIEDSSGEEWSHEAGHAYSLGHYPGQWRGSSHQRPSVNGVNAAWGWDRDLNRFIANFFWDKGGNQNCCGGSIPPFQGNRFNTDVMASGHASSPLSYYALHTPYVLNVIQNFIERHAVFSSSSPTGFKIWDPQSLRYINYVNYVRPPSVIISHQAQFNAIANDTSGNFIRTQLIRMGIVQLIPSNGNWIRNVHLPTADAQLEGSIVWVDSDAQSDMFIIIGNQSHRVSYRNSSIFIVRNRNWIILADNLPFNSNTLEIILQQEEKRACPHRNKNNCEDKCDCERGCGSVSNKNEGDFENANCGVKTVNGLIDPNVMLPFYPPIYTDDTIYRIDTQQQLTRLGNDPSGAELSTILQRFQEVEIIVRDGAWTSNISFPAARAISLGRIISFTNRATWDVTVMVNNTPIIYRTGDSTRYVAENNLWHSREKNDALGTRVPRQFGVPVTTVVGYYDPERILPTTIYPALHGGYGFIYSSSQNVSPLECYLRVTTSTDIIHYQLARGRINPAGMNKFHINIRQIDRTVRADVIIRNVIVTSLTLNPPTTRLGYTVNGLSSRSMKFINGKANINELNNFPEKLFGYLAENFTVNIQLTKTDRLDMLKLPPFAFNGQRVEIAGNSGSPTNVILDDKQQYIIARGEVAKFIFIEDAWQKEIDSPMSSQENAALNTENDLSSDT